jgi:hypothetical protein
MSCVKSQLCPFEDAPVLRISLPYIYDLSAALKPLNNIDHGTPINQWMYILYNAETELQGFLFSSVYCQTLKASNAPGRALLEAIKKLTSDSNKDRNLDFIDTYNVSNKLATFEAVLSAEMNVCNSYFVTKKRGYDISDLINQAEVLFPDDLVVKVPEAIPDIQQAGKCIAFEVPTAAGFHLMRALELILRLYFDAVANGEARPTSNNWGDYLNVMNTKRLGDAKVIAVLKQIKDLHRNEFIHPETTLTLDEAIGLLGIAQSAIAYMLCAVPEKQLKREAPV